MRRRSKSSTEPNTLLELEKVFIGVIWKSFFNSSYNYQNFIEDHQTFVRCKSETSTVGVSTLPDYACTEGNMKLIAANADLLIMIIYV